ncbi:hypothetical protein BDV12DRAFT_160193 [Aspergillus spectabilis]
MAYKLVALLACLLVITGYANENVGNFDAQDVADLEDLLNYHIVNAARALEAADIIPRSEVATVTVTETVCGPDGPTSVGTPPIISIPETTLVTGTSQGAPAPTTVQPPVSSGTDSGPSVEPTSGSASPSSPDGQATTTQTSSSSSADGTEAPTETSDAPTATLEPTANSGVTQGGTNSLILALTLTFVRLFGV